MDGVPESINKSIPQVHEAKGVPVSVPSATRESVWEGFMGRVSKVSQAALPAWVSRLPTQSALVGHLKSIHRGSGKVPPGTCPIRVAVFFAHLTQQLGLDMGS